MNETQDQQATLGLRDYFAAAALGEIIAKSEYIGEQSVIKSISQLSYKIADAMLEARKETEK